MPPLFLISLRGCNTEGHLQTWVPFHFPVLSEKVLMVVRTQWVNCDLQVNLCRAKTTGEVYAMKKLKKSEMLSRGQVLFDLA